MSNADYVNVWNHETVYVTEVYTRDQILDQLGRTENRVVLCTESLACELARKRIGDNNAHRLIPASHMIREFLNR